MSRPEILLERLERVGAALRDSGHALALIGLGSVGLERERLDAHSDLDFFAIVEPGHKARYIDRLDWLAQAHPLAWHFRNTVDGHKALMADGVFCEFAVFEPRELEVIPFAPGRVVWRREGVDEAIAQPRRPVPDARLPDETWIVGEALGNLFVGLQRWLRGERLVAARLVQVHALDRLIELDALRHAPQADSAADPFNRERRIERRQPSMLEDLPEVMAGYARTPQAALAVLDALARRGAQLDAAMTARIRALAAQALTAPSGSPAASPGTPAR
ncbi:hypothetical protein [Caldimonas sp. KR1-144]|uniref:hypothetical protein n=1 Tax=Caldimonas sp. KR1-144 TaxID=3400911 RepID=UPI003C055C2C